MTDDDQGHDFTSAGFHDDATCNNCGLGILQYQKSRQPCATPDQPTGMNELREILTELEQSNVSRAYPDAAAFLRAEAAIQQLVERCIGSDEDDMDVTGLSPLVTVSMRNKLRADIRHNFQQAGLLRGEDV